MIDPTLRDALLAVSPASLARALARRGIRAHAFAGLELRASTPIAGPAHTLRLIPARDEAAGDLAQAIGEVPEGAVLVIDAAGSGGALPFARLLAAAVARAGVAGLVTDAGLPDDLALPAWGRDLGRTPGSTGLALAGTGEPVACAGAAVHPGDIVVAGPDGAVVLPADIAESVALEAVEQQRLDLWLLREAERGADLSALLPPDAETRARFEAETKNP
ncbi:dimethylmenaquinone methyltransferase [Methylobacterium radiodurans]|uniref:Dimethylmenaquinone methyltransferase n=1 Tax=Methylobacterium radiodurans TaxID=2202828 RepID=A0A2U8VX65_9HYPH|nr:dimethylmenaquinone methyltransferase [Methylobacterium radiodurans]AWN38068.1 dimethylmenaquinone methyltransferase [Methylobacterium radiodurans]